MKYKLEALGTPKQDKKNPMRFTQNFLLVRGQIKGHTFEHLGKQWYIESSSWGEFEQTRIKACHYLQIA